MRVGIDHTFFEAGDGHDYFECRSRRKLSLGGAIVERPELIGGQRIPLAALNATGENIGIEGRRAGEGENRAAMNIDGEDVALLNLESLVVRL